MAQIRASAQKGMTEMKKDKDDVQKVRICLNQITMENYDTKKD